MPRLPSRAIMTALTISGILSSTSALSLANFTPRIENLPQQCQGVYTTPIAGCEAGDFTNRSPGATCSSACVAGLVTIMKAVESACAAVDVPETSIIGVFLLGKGIPSLCPGIEVVTVSPSVSRTTQAPAQSTSAAEATTTSSEEAQSTTGSSSVEATSTSSTIAIDTTVPTTFATSAPASTASSSSTAQATTTATSQKSNADSGGGSPFDIVATGSSAVQLPVKRLVLGAIVGVVAMAVGAV